MRAHALKAHMENAPHARSSVCQVKIGAPGLTYSTYDAMACYLGVRSEWYPDRAPSAGDVGHVVAMAQHGHFDNVVVAAVRISTFPRAGRVVLMQKLGLKLLAGAWPECKLPRLVSQYAPAYADDDLLEPESEDEYLNEYPASMLGGDSDDE